MTDPKKTMTSEYAVSEIPAYDALHPTVSAEQRQQAYTQTRYHDQLPLYFDDNFTSPEAINKVAATLKTKGGQNLPIQEYPPHANNKEAGKDDEQIRRIVYSYFNCIRNGNVGLVASFWGSKLVTTETTNVSGETPLIAAVGAGHVHMVRYLLDVGTDMDALAITGTTTSRGIRDRREKKLHTYRTALQYAAELGNLPMVKLLLERGADDSIVAPDGQLALRLAAINGHREIVDYLPVRRGGGYRRWKVKHATALYRCKKAGYKIYKLTKVFVWEIPKVFVWSIPKHLIVLPLIKGIKWLHEHWREIPKIMAEARKKTLKGLKRFSKGTWKFFKELPGNVWKFIKGCAKLLKRFILFIWRTIKAIPNALKIVFLWLWSGIKRAGSAIGHAFQRIFSFIHTIVAAIFSFFQRITLKDVLNAFIDCPRAIFIDAPKKVWQWTCSFGEMSLKAMKALFGGLGECIVLLFKCFIWLVAYIPTKIWEIIMACGGSIRNGGREMMVWVNPKRM